MSLVEIEKLPTAENAAIHLHATDNVVVAPVPLSPRQQLRGNGTTLRVTGPIPAGHKMALTPIAAGEVVHRYGQAIGRAKKPIVPGEHIHTHNLAFEEIAFAYEFPSGEIGYPQAPASVP